MYHITLFSGCQPYKCHKSKNVSRETKYEMRVVILTDIFREKNRNKRSMIRFLSF